MLAAGLGLVTCGQTDSIIVDVGGTPDTLVVNGSIDSTFVTVADTTILPPDTVIVTIVDTIVSGTDTTFVTTVDTVVTVDTVIVVDTVNVTLRLVASVSTLNMLVGQTATLSVTTQTALGFPAGTPSSVVWVSDDPTIASVNGQGSVRGESAGSTEIFAIASGLSATIPVTVADTAVQVPLPVITTASLRGAIVGVQYADTLRATGGNGIFDWALLLGQLPTGLTLETNTGIIRGMPTAAMTRQITVQVASGGRLASKALILTVAASGPPSPQQLTGGGPNLPGGASLVFRLDVSQPNQRILNPLGTFGCSTAWSAAPVASPARGTFWNQDAGDGNLFVRFAWAAGMRESNPGDCEYNVPAGSYNNLYIRVVWRANSGWQTNGGGGKHVYLQNGAGSGTINAAAAFGTDGTYGLTAVTMNLYTPWLHATGNPHNPTGNWYSDEWRFTNLETNLADGTVAIWVDGAPQPLSGPGSGVRFSQSGNGINIFRLGPFHGGSGAKTQNGDYIDYKLIEVWSF